MEKKPTNETTNNSENENVDLKLKKDENNEMIVNDAENAGIDDDWDEDRIPIIRNSINISEFLENNRNAIIDNDCNEISSNEENEYGKINDNGIPNIRNNEQFIEELLSCYN